jgi:anti-anti-sigma regulatory factor
MEIIVSEFRGRVPVTVLQPFGDIDAHTYQELIAQGQAVYNAGARAVVLDLGQVHYLSSSGLVAIHSIARLLQGQAPPDPEAGWSAFHAIERAQGQGPHPYLKLVNPQPGVDKVLTTTGFRHMFEVHTDLAAAVASF